jgi:hypothetical protein
MKRPVFLLVFVLLFSPVCSANAAVPPTYDFPFEDPYLATVAGSLHESEIPPIVFNKEVMGVMMYKDKPLPPLLQHLQEFTFSLTYHEEPAPLIFIIPGTGSNFNSGKTLFLQKIFYHAGFHVITLNSTFNWRFAAMGSRSERPGIVTEDAEDFYRIMETVYDAVSSYVQVTDFFLTGYSLGATTSAFVSRLDEKARVFDFKKVLLINPPVNVFTSAMIFDGFVEQNLEEGADVFFDRLLEKISRYFQYKGGVTIDSEFLYDIYRLDPLSQSELKGLIGIAFRFALANIIFSVDLLTQGGYVVPEGKELRVGESTTPYLKRALNWRFIDYFEKVLLPDWKNRHPGASAEDLIRRLGLRRIAAYLKTAPHIGLMHNADDIILGKGDLEFLRSTFEDRAVIYPQGGHCGNMGYPPNVRYMIDFFKGETE